MKKILISLLLGFMIMSCGISASASGNIPLFDDVSPDAYYAEGVQYMRSRGWINGIGNNKFAPDEKCTLWELVVVTGRVLYDDDTLDSDEIIERAIKDGWFDDLNDVYMASKVCREFMYQMIFEATGTLYYGDAATNYSAAATESAVEAGLCANGSDDMELISRAEMVYALYQLTTHKIEFAEPELFHYMDVTIENGHSSVIPHLLALASKLPTELWKEFYTCNGSVVIGDVYITQYESENNMIVSGLFSPSENKIYLKGYTSLLHEMGHFIYFNWDISNQMESVYKEEADAASELLGTYAKTNYTEMFAESFEYYFRWPEKRELLQVQLPRTFALIKKIEGCFLD